jgi:hypothetical protein
MTRGGTNQKTTGKSVRPWLAIVVGSFRLYRLDHSATLPQAHARIGVGIIQTPRCVHIQEHIFHISCESRIIV